MHIATMYAREFAQIATPIGTITVAAEGPMLVSLVIGQAGSLVPRGTNQVLDRAVGQLTAWFNAELTDFDLPLLPLTTPRGEALRQGMIDIGYGETLSYGALARRLGSAPRAIGQACARNPLPIIVPCHRILSAGDVLGAYSAGDGPSTKAWLLAHEQRHRPLSGRLF